MSAQIFQKLTFSEIDYAYPLSPSLSIPPEAGGRPEMGVRGAEPPDKATRKKIWGVQKEYWQYKNTGNRECSTPERSFWQQITNKGNVASDNPQIHKKNNPGAVALPRLDISPCRATRTNFKPISTISELPQSGPVYLLSLQQVPHGKRRVPA